MYIYIHNGNISKVEYNLNGSTSLCSEDLYVLHKLSVVTVQRLTVSETERTLELLKSSSEYVRQMLKTAQSGSRKWPFFQETN